MDGKFYKFSFSLLKCAINVVERNLRWRKWDQFKQIIRENLLSKYLSWKRILKLILVMRWEEEKKRIRYEFKIMQNMNKHKRTKREETSTGFFLILCYFYSQNIVNKISLTSFLLTFKDYFSIFVICDNIHTRQFLNNNKWWKKSL